MECNPGTEIQSVLNGPEKKVPGKENRYSVDGFIPMLSTPLHPYPPEEVPLGKPVALEFLGEFSKKTLFSIAKC